MSPRRVLVTGAGGVLGTELLEQLRAVPGLDVVGVTSRGDAERGVLRWAMGRENAPPGAQGPWDVVIHSAANTKWNLPAEQAVSANVRPTEALAQVLSAGTHLVHVSTAYAGGHFGSVEPTAVEAYRNTYEWSKAASERLVRELHRGPLTIARPPLLVGRRSDGHVARYSGVYLFFKGMASSTAPAVVGHSDALLEIVPVDDTARRILQLALGTPPPAPVVDVIGSGGAAPTVAQVLALGQKVMDELRAEHGLAPLPPTPLLDARRWERFYLPFARQHFDAKQSRVLDLLGAFIPYTTIRHPIEVTHVVPDVMPALRVAVRAWAERHRALVLAEPAPWQAEAVA
ncbi:SDR family oxidoreductase [Motilibacter deserti]|uniref:NAD-dependent epimerase/dehydratase family protein n=1 Tax=Motilibacter deserti TaxID=2714956 RepID=A0ABX0GYN7_9ACTN|nr:SDR family oxidoreductase [Motilibacter deserti]NHC16106.1 NAD-dependent epimerase/dehydratase family protein [Motilibacter deserti]